MSPTSTIHIVGAGVAGLSAALIAAGEGRRVILYEAAPQAGGRCRSFYDKRLKTIIDNGNHLVLGANHAALAYLQKLGTLDNCLTSEKPHYPFIDIATRRHWHFAPPRFKGIPWYEWRHLLRLIRPARHETVSQCIPSHTALYRTLIEPLTLAALNTHPQEASAPLLAMLGRALITGGRTAWQTYIPSPSLSAIFIDPALARIKGRGGSIHYQHPIEKLEMQDNAVTALHSGKTRIAIAPDDSVILAVPPSVLQTLLPYIAPNFTYSAIINGHFLWPQAGMFRDAMPFLGIINGTAQWIFFHEGRISTTTSAANPALAGMDEEELAQLLWQDVCRALYLDEARLPSHRIIKEKRATYTATAENLAKRPQTTTLFQNVFLAGDYISCAHPATLEAAIGSGFAAASIALARK